MPPRPIFLLCFLGRVLLMAVLGLWLFGAFKTKTFLMPMMFWSQIFVQSFIGIGREKQRWIDRSAPGDSKNSWIIVGGIGVGLLFASAILSHFSLLRSRELTELALFLFPIATVFGHYFDEWGIERPLRQWHASKSTTPTTTASGATITTPTTQTNSVQQHVGRP